MPTTIDSLSIEIQSNSAGAAGGLDALAKSLGELKRNGGFGTAVKNLKELTAALKTMTSVTSNASKIGSLAEAMEKLKNVGSTGKGVKNLAESLRAFKEVDYTALDEAANSGERFQSLANSLSILSAVKSGGIGTMVNGLSRIGEVTKKLDTETIDAFTERVTELSEKLAPFSEQMTTIGAAFSGINSALRLTSVRVGQVNTKINIGVFNFSNLVNVLSKVKHALQAVARKFAQIVSDASEWEGISARFGRGFGAQAQETYDWVQKLNQEMHINTQQFMQYSSTYATMLTGFGVAQEDASKMALGYMELTYDIWAGYNDIYKNLDDAAAAVRSAIAGEVEPVRKAGFTIIESTLEQTAANHGLKISLETATEAQKSYLRYLTLVDQAQSQNLVGTYASEMNTAEGVMRTFNQQLKSLAQSFASLFLPVLVKGMPYVQAFVDLLKDGVYWAASLFGVEIQAVDFSGYESGVDGITDSLDDATESAKEAKRQLLGIDELNVLNDNSSSDSSSASGFEGLDVDSLWDETIFDSIQSQVEELKDTVKEALDAVLAIAAGLLTWTITTTLINKAITVSELFAKAKETLGIINGMKKTIGLSLVVTGLSLEYQGVKAIANGEADWQDYVKAALGAAMGIGGSLLFFGAGPVGWAVGIGLALTTAIVSWSVAEKQKFWETELGQQIQEWKAQAEKATEINARVRVNLETIQSDYNAVISEWGAIRDMVDEVFRLDGISNKTAEEVSMMQGYVDTINGMGLDGLCLHFDEATGRISETKQEVYAVIEALEAQARTEAAHEALVNVYKERYDAAWGLKESQEALEEVETRLEALTAEHTRVQEEYNKSLEDGTGGNVLLASELATLEETIKEVEAAQLELTKAVEDGTRVVAECDRKIQFFSSELADLKSKANALKDPFDRATAALNRFNDSLRENGELSLTGIDLTTNNRLVGTSIGSIGTFASGGFPSSGEFFMARENGIPEMVGRMGNRTAVANNDQIVEGIANGVASANDGVIAAIYSMSRQVVSAVENNGGVYLNGKKVSEETTKNQNRQTRMYGKPVHA